MVKWISKKIFESAKKDDDLLLFGHMGKRNQWPGHWPPIQVRVIPLEKIGDLVLILDDIMDLASEGIGTNRDIIKQAQKAIKILEGGE